jgi:hypothetical protein
MKGILLMAAVAALIGVPAFAQAAEQGDQPAVKPAAAVPAGAAKDPEAKPAQKDMKLAQGPGQSKVTEDARHCLELASNTEIIKCAEPYLPVKMVKGVAGDR